MGGDPTGINVNIADKFMDKSIGWMFRKVRDDMGLLITHCNSIHTFFVRAPIDTVFLDAKYSVIKVISNLKPWRVVMPVTNAKMVLELPPNSALSFGLKTGDVLEIK